MSYHVVSFPKLLPEKGKHFLVVAENWVVNNTLLYPGIDFSTAAKQKFVKCGQPPDQLTWDKHEFIDVLGTFGKFFLAFNFLQY